MGLSSTLIYTSELILCSTICVPVLHGTTFLNWQLLCNSVATGRPYFVQFLAFQTMCSSWPYPWLAVASVAANAAAAFAVAAATMRHETVPAA